MKQRNNQVKIIVVERYTKKLINKTIYIIIESGIITKNQESGIRNRKSEI